VQETNEREPDAHKTGCHRAAALKTVVYAMVASSKTKQASQ
jgi:hypothetical protein